MFYASDSFPEIREEFIQRCRTHLMRASILWQDFAGGGWRRGEVPHVECDIVGLQSVSFLCLAAGVTCEFPGGDPAYVRVAVPLNSYPDICISLGSERQSCDKVIFLENFATYQWSSEHHEPAFFAELLLDKACYPEVFGDSKLRELLVQNAKAIAVQSVQGTPFDKLKKIVSGVLKVSEEGLTLDTHYYKDLGADSLDLVNIFYFLQEEFGLEEHFLEQEWSQEELELLKTLGGTLTYLENHVGHT